jgi:hypothetical protein
MKTTKPKRGRPPVAIKQRRLAVGYSCLPLTHATIARLSRLSRVSKGIVLDQLVSTHNQS